MIFNSLLFHVSFSYTSCFARSIFSQLLHASPREEGQPDHYTLLGNGNEIIAAAEVWTTCRHLTRGRVR